MLTFIQPCTITHIKKIAALIGFLLLVVNDVSTYGMPHNIVMETEIWKPIEFLSGYSVSNLGRIKSDDHYINDERGHKRFVKGNVLNPSSNSSKGSNNYLRLRIYNKSYYVHRLVAKTFIPNPENKPMVNHIDGNKKNNAVVNLEWNTCKENNHHAIINNLSKPPKGGSEYLKKRVLNKDTGEIFISCVEAAKSININNKYLSRMLTGERKNKTSFKYI